MMEFCTDMKHLNAPFADFSAKSAVPSFTHIQKLYNTLGDMVCAINFEGQFEYVSAGSEQLWGYTPEELMGRNFREFIHPDDLEKTSKVANSFISGNYNAPFENRYFRKDGTILPVIWSCIWDCRDKLLYCVARDGSEKKQVKSLQLQFAQKIKKNNKQISTLLERITDGFLALDNDWRIIYWNRQAEILNGKKREELLTLSLWECFPGSEQSVFGEMYHKAVDTQQPVQFEVSDASGRWFDFSAYPSKEGLSIFFRDITGRKHYERELSLLSLIVKETSNAVLLMTPEGVITWVNDAFGKITGYTPEEVIGKMPNELIAGPETDPEILRHIKEQREQGAAYSVELINYAKDGRKFWVEVTGQPIRNAEGQVEQYFALQNDITERRQLQEQLDRERTERQKRITSAVIQAQEQERALIGRELHDNVNQVLTTVKLYNELALNHAGKADELLPKSIEYLNSTINEIRILSRRLSEPTLGKIELHETIRELINALSATNKIGIFLDAPDLDTLEAPEDLHIGLYRIIQEHLTNVLKHAGAETVHITIRKTHKVLSLLIVDDGRGFEPGEIKSGLGISNMISRAESLGGTLRLISAPGAGCTLLVSIPLV
jgi:PAS domain S-box-containing protein